MSSAHVPDGLRNDGDLPIEEAAHVVWIGRWVPPELDGVGARENIRLSRFDSALRAISALARTGAHAALIAADEVDGRERAAISALRSAGVAAIAVLYRSHLAHRAVHSEREGADATLVLPTGPGELDRLVTTLLGRPAPRVPIHVLPTRPPEPAPPRAAPRIIGRTTVPTAPAELTVPATGFADIDTPTEPPRPEPAETEHAPLADEDPAGRTIPTSAILVEPPEAPSETRDRVPDGSQAAHEPASNRPLEAAETVRTSETAPSPELPHPAPPDTGTATEILRAPVTQPIGPPDRRALESLVGDAALVHRMVGDLDRLLDRVLESFRARSTATRCSLMLLDRTRGELLMQRAIGLPDRDAWTPIPLGEGIAGRVARNGIPLLAADISEVGDEFESWDGSVPTRRGYETRSCLVLPLCGGEGVAGVVCLADKESGEPFVDADLRSLLFLSDQSGQALENAVKLRQMRDLAVVDELTGLYNRRYFQKALAREVQRARRYDRPLTVAIMDLDHFKKFNDTCGHPAGDRALAAVGDLLRTALREVDIVARHGGEEFAVILPETSPAATNGTKAPFPFLERLRQRIEETEFEGQERLPSGNLTVSIGVACFPADADTAEDLFQKADDALYASKAHGRNVVTYRGRPVAD